MRKIVCVALLFCATAVVAQGPLKIFPTVIKFIGRTLHIIGPDQPQGQPSVKTTPDVTLQIAGASVHAAKQLCPNWTWAAVVETILAQDAVPLTQDEMVTRAEGGTVCKDQSPDFERMTKALSGNLYLDDGHKVTLETRNVTGAPTVIDDILVAMTKQHPLVLFWKGRAYLLKGVVYDELIISSNGARVFEIKELKLLDPAATKPEEREISFLRDKDDSDQIDGVMDVVVKPEESQSWLHPETEYEKNHRSPAERGVMKTPDAPPSTRP